MKTTGDVFYAQATRYLELVLELMQTLPYSDRNLYRDKIAAIQQKTTEELSLIKDGLEF